MTSAINISINHTLHAQLQSLQTLPSRPTELGYTSTRKLL